MSQSDEGDGLALGELRGRIDAIDAEIHRLLIARGTVIDALITTKKTDRPGAAFRPAREAEMMRRLVARHEGKLPLATVEHIWREIITTFTRMQAPFDVAIDASFEPERMHDLARFVFGFAVKVTTRADAAAVVRAVAGANMLGLVPRATAGAWWRGLIGADAPKIMAFVPFIIADGSPDLAPAFVVAPPLSDATAADLTVFAVEGDHAPARPEQGEILAMAAGSERLEALVAAPRGVTAEALHGKGVRRVVAVGGFARGIVVGGRSTPLYEELSK